MPEMNRRTAIGALAGAGSLAALSAHASAARSVPGLDPEKDLGWSDEKLEYVLPPLPYPYDALEPYIDAKTMEIHHDKHHAGYVKGMNKALSELRNIRSGTGDASLVAHWTQQLSFNGGGHINHTLFWQAMAPADKGGGGVPQGGLARQIDRDFGTFEQFAAQFKTAATAVKGSGWGWLVWEPMGHQLMVLQVENHQKLILNGCVPILGVDVWEHAYYLKYQNDRSAYVDAFMQVANWPWATARFERISA